MSAPAKDISGFGGFQGERIRKKGDYHKSRAIFHRPKAEDIGLKFKDLVGIPWMVAFALRNDGWYLRSDCIWAKGNPMPSSTRDRPTTAHEYVFLLSKSEKYFYDQQAIKEPAKTGGTRNKRSVWHVNAKPYKGAHFAVWPEELVEPMILAGSAPGDIVLDPFSGSATTGAVAMRLGRNYVGIDLNSDYTELAIARLRGLPTPKNEDEDEINALEFLK